MSDFDNLTDLETALLEKVKTALRRREDTFDEEIWDLCRAAMADLDRSGAGEAEDGAADPLVLRAVITYCRANFGDLEPEEYDRMIAAYHTQRAELHSSTGYTDWGDSA